MTAVSLTRLRPEVSLAGAPLEPTLHRLVASIVIRQIFGAPALAEIAIEAPFEGLENRLAAGVELMVSVGPGPAMFAGRITGLEHEFGADGRRVLRVRAHDALHGLRVRRRFRVVEEASAASLWSEAAVELGLDFDAVETGPTRRIVQAGTSDLACLVAAGLEEGLHPTIREGVLRLVSLAGFGEPIDLGWGEALLAARIDEAGERAARSSRAEGWDPFSAKAYSASAALSRQDQEVELRSFGLGALNADEGALFGVNRVARSEAQIAADAQQAFDCNAAAETVVTGTAWGDPALGPGVRVTLSGLAPKEALTVVLARTTHSFDVATGYTTEFSTEPPPRRARAETPIVTLGQVVDIRDPDGGARCKVKLPAFGDATVGYLSVLIAGAGPGKGAAALPDVGDEVVALFPTGDLAEGLILGGLYGGARLPRGVTTQDPRAVVLASGGDQRLVLGGRQKTLSLSTSRGDTLALGGAQGQLLVAGDLTISAVGGTITIKANKIKFERGNA
ncbi:phage baseplate assembly protein V [Methylocapsa acidiphila]|uniref:phage baseplate assembly protein V n=1 Tax=Methylocapsa acidiphila TaxID=133552 RepID=UPI0003FA82FC|nr:phage baseplate assembly protein V [Methylocapsa acidiphila]